MTLLTAATEAIDAPVIMQISQNAVAYHGALRPLTTATLAMRRVDTVVGGVGR